MIIVVLALFSKTICSLCLPTDYIIALGYMRSPPNVVQYNRRSGDLVWKEDAFKSFPAHGVSNFKELRQRPEYCFFDKTAFIRVLASFDEPALVFLRPRRSGKSLALSTLAHFHGREHLPDYKPLFEVSDFCSLMIFSTCSKCLLACLSSSSCFTCRAWLSMSM